MERVTFNSIRRAYNTWLTATAETLSDVYGTWSTEKADAYNYCRKLYHEYNGSLFRIIGANTFGFSVAFTACFDGAEVFVYITKLHDRYAYLD